MTCHHWVSQSTYLRMIGLIHSYFRYLPQAFTSPNWNCGKKSSCDVQFGILWQILFSLIWILDFRREIYSFKLSHYLIMHKEWRFVAHRRGWLKTKESSTCSGKKVEHFADPIYYPLLYAPPVRKKLCGCSDGWIWTGRNMDLSWTYQLIACSKSWNAWIISKQGQLWMNSAYC